jgi:hypothetical protein
MPRAKLKAVYALAMLLSFGAGMLMFVLAADEQSMVSGGQPDPAALTLQDLAAQGPGGNRHVALSDFFFGRHYVFTTDLVQFNEVYLPLFAKGQAEDGRNLRLLLWIRNDRNSNLPFVENRQQLDEFVRQGPRAVSGVLHSAPTTVRTLTADAYPGTDTQSLQVLWAREFPEQRSATLLWAIMGLCLAAGCGFLVAYKRQPGRV